MEKTLCTRNARPAVIFRHHLPGAHQLVVHILHSPLDIMLDDIISPDIMSPDIMSPDIMSPDIMSPDIINTISYIRYHSTISYTRYHIYDIIHTIYLPGYGSTIIY